MIAKKSFFEIGKIFDVVSGRTSNLKLLAPGNTPFVSASEKNNGVTAYVDDNPTFPGNLITISRNGSVCEAFFQPEPFCASLDDIRVLIPKGFKLNKYIGLFLCTVIRQEKFRYTYGRKFGTGRIRETLIELPAKNEDEPDWDWIDNYIKNHLLPHNVVFQNILEDKFNTASIIKSGHTLTVANWKTFKYGGENGIFIIKNGYYNKKPDHTEPGTIPFVGSSEFNNGITEYYSLDEISNNDKDSRSKKHDISLKIFKGNSVTVSNNGSVGNAFYQPDDFTCSHDVNVLLLKDREWNKYIALFICTIIKLEKYRWSYGRKWRPMRMPESEIKLPVKENGELDFDFMESFMKSLPFSSTI